MRIPKLSNGMRYGRDAQGNRICTGAMMGRSNLLPENPTTWSGVLRVYRMGWVDGDYDPGCEKGSITRAKALLSRLP